MCAVCMHTSSRSQRTDTPLSYSALTSVGLCLSFVEQCTHARTVRTESPTHNVEHSPAVCAHPFRTDTAHPQLTHRALTQRTHDLRCRVIRDERQLALGVHYLTTVFTHPLCTLPPCCRKRYDQYDLFRLIYDLFPRLNPFVFFISPFFIRQCSHKLSRHVPIEEGCLKAAPTGGH